MSKHLVVKQFESGEISAEEALQTLGDAIKYARTQGRSTASLEAAVTHILGIAEEPAAEDHAGATAWESSRRGSTE